MQSILRHASLALVLLVAACGSPPRGVENDADAPLPPPPADEAEARAPDTSEAYDLESEGSFPAPSRDVEFEEDQLPPPESMEAAPLGTNEAPVRQETLPPEIETPVEPSVQTPVPPQEALETRRGWRVQLTASGERAEAERVAREARARLNAAVYVDLEGSLYKVRAGDFVDRAAAQRLRDRARANGYDGAWVVTTEVVAETTPGS